MGLTIRYQFSPATPPGLALENPGQARQIIREAVAITIAALEKRGIPCEELPFRHERKTGNFDGEFYEASILLAGPAEGCEPLTFGWSRVTPKPWSNKQFSKTQYAADFLAAHSAICAALSELEDAGYIGAVYDDGEYYRSGKTLEQLAETYGQWMAMLGDLHDLLQGAGFTYQSPTPGGVIKRFGPQETAAGPEE